MAIETFAFGDPLPVLDQRDFWNYLQASFNGRWYEPPVSRDGLARAFSVNPHHQSAILVKASLLASHFRPHRLLSRFDFRKLALDHLVFGDSYLERRRAVTGGVSVLKPLLARWSRIKKDGTVIMLADGQEIGFAEGSVLHLMDPDINQEIYGTPSYLGALQAALLNEAATLFRRKYYVNGSHAGFILYLTDAAQNQEDIDSLRKALKEARGPGNFRNLFLYTPGGKKDGLQLIPISEVTAKDEFLHMKNVTRDDILAAHRVPPQLLGMVPSNTGGFGSVEQAARIFFIHEIKPLMAVFETINEWIGEEVVAFKDYQDDEFPSRQAASPPAPPSL